MQKRIIVLSAPSGVGKSTLIKCLMPHYPKMSFSVSATTRPMRPGEVDGQDYYFMTPQDFAEAVDKGEFFEHAQAYQNFYGTFKKEIERIVDQGLWPVLDVDAQGLQTLQNFFAQENTVDIISILALPKTIDVVKQRLTDRGETEEVIASRMRLVYADIQASALYRYAVINDDLQECVDNIRRIFDDHPALNSQDFPHVFEHAHAQNLLLERTVSSAT